MCDDWQCEIKNCHFSNPTLLGLQEGVISWFPPTWWLCMHVCIYVGAHCIHVWLRYHRVWKKSDGRVGAGETDSKTTSNILFSLMGCQMGKKKHKDKQRGPTFSLHTNRKGLWERKSHRRENSPPVVPINFPGNQLGDLSLRWNPLSSWCWGPFCLLLLALISNSAFNAFKSYICNIIRGQSVENDERKR